MCSNDPWSAGSTRRQSERGTADRRQHDPLRRARAVSCRLLGASESWFCKWRNRAPTLSELRGQDLDKAVLALNKHLRSTVPSHEILLRSRLGLMQGDADVQTVPEES